MPYRMAMYGLLIADKYRGRKVEQIFIYLGSDPIKMDDGVSTGGIDVRYRLVDIREFRAAERLRMELPAMGVYIEIEDNVILEDIHDAGVARGQAEGSANVLRGLLEYRFGPNPESPEQVPASWARRVYSAPMLNPHSSGTESLRPGFTDHRLARRNRPLIG
jgi:hypothetical protein